MAQVQKPSIPKGTRDFSPEQMAGRNYIFDTVRSVFKKFGYKPIETPSMENLSTLLGKYGEEGDKLLFKVLNSGDAFSGISPDEFNKFIIRQNSSREDVEKSGLEGGYLYDDDEAGIEKVVNSNALSLRVCEKGLRYDLTVPFARYVVQHRNEITFPFKRYQIQPVWRADRPQKGRYREFYQCDVDVIGSKSLLNELELVQIVDEVFGIFGINVCIKINNRKILSGLAEVMGFPEKLVEITIAMDKIDKIGLDAVKEEMLAGGVDEKGFSILEPVLTFSGTTSEKIALISDVVKDSETGRTGVEELKTLFGLIEKAGIGQKVEIDLSLARGLNYYTGAIFEVKALDFAIGSICGGGRYDNLTGIFGLPDVSGVGISFGADRIYDVLTGLDKFPKDAITATKVLLSNMDESSVAYLLPLAKTLREKGISCEVYPDQSKLKKQFEYAEKNHIPFFIIAGESEVAANTVNVKNLETGEQTTLPMAEAAEFLDK
ncbi:MAG: histidine--tRNA ligase [Bacteroidales bacterium]|nr:histidine--tRNA ligase [Bacteroidales bacterium]